MHLFSHSQSYSVIVIQSSPDTRLVLEWGDGVEDHGLWESQEAGHRPYHQQLDNVPENKEKETSDEHPLELEINWRIRFWYLTQFCKCHPVDINSQKEESTSRSTSSTVFQDLSTFYVSWKILILYLEVEYDKRESGRQIAGIKKVGILKNVQRNNLNHRTFKAIIGDSSEGEHGDGHWHGL